MDTQLQKSGLKKTKAREAIYEFLQTTKEPTDVTQILDFLKSRGIDTDKVTVYRILDIFVQKNLARKLEFQEGKFRYEGAGEHHHHLICTNCKRVEDIDLENDISDHEAQILKDTGFKVTDHSLEFFGLCKNCQKTF